MKVKIVQQICFRAMIELNTKKNRSMILIMIWNDIKNHMSFMTMKEMFNKNENDMSFHYVENSYDGQIKSHHVWNAVTVELLL